MKQERDVVAVPAAPLSFGVLLVCGTFHLWFLDEEPILKLPAWSPASKNLPQILPGDLLPKLRWL